jgi:hypothetical protein
MTRNYQIFLQVLFILLFSACVDEAQLELEDKAPRLVVNGLITNIGGAEKMAGNYIQLSWSIPANQYNAQSSYTSTDIPDAVVIIKDDEGHQETLIPWHRLSSSPYIIQGRYYINTIAGKPGHSYELSITLNGKTYTASAYMPPVPEIDTVTYEFTKGMEGKFDFYVPRISFTDPAGVKNYYLYTFGYNDRAWGISLLDDRFLNGYVKSLDVFQGQSNEWWITSYPHPGMPYRIEMHSLTAEAYQYYSASINVFKNDGGTYRPAPATPVSNISNGALGYFRASAVSAVEATMP